MSGYVRVPNVDPFRLYVPATDDFAADGYPVAWHAELKYQVRDQADHRCVRCRHPYVGKEDAKRNGLIASTAEWSRCDTSCTHGGKVRMRELYRPGDFAWSEWDLDESGHAAGSTIMDYGPGGEDCVRWEVEAAWRVLTVHHLNGDKADCHWWNLVALCQRCHLEIQGKVRMEVVWPWEHTDWFKPYVAGFYAHAYLNEDLTREATMARIVELLNLERIA